MCVLSFSWLSWQVHRSLAVLVKGGAVIPFHQEFHRLNSSSKPVPGFVNYITVPHILPPYIYSTSQNGDAVVSEVKPVRTKSAWNEDTPSTQTKEKIQFSPEPQSPELERTKDNPQPPQRADTNAQTHKKSPGKCPKAAVKPAAVQSVSVRKPKHAVEAGCNQPGPSGPLTHTKVSYFQSQLRSLTFTSTTEKKGGRESNTCHAASSACRQHRPVAPNTSLENWAGQGVQGLFSQFRNRNKLMKPLDAAARQTAPRRQWYRPLNLNPKVDVLSDHPEVLSDHPEVLSPPTSPQELTMGLLSSKTHSKGHLYRLSTKVYHLGTRRQDQPCRRYQPSVQIHPTTEAPGSTSTLRVPGTHLKPLRQSASKLFTTKLHPQPPAPQLVEPTSGLSRTARSRPLLCHSSLGPIHDMGQQEGWRPFYRSIHLSLRQNKKISDRHPAAFK